MQQLPQRTSLVAQTAQVLRAAIAEGKWPRWLPGEIELTRRLRIGRVTLRAALVELEREKLITSGQGRRREVIAKPAARRRPSSASQAVGLLTPEPLHHLSSATVFWIDELREHLERSGKLLEIHESAAAYRLRPAHALEDLVARIQPAGWVLYRSTPQMQAWFSEQGTPAVIAGSPHPGVALRSLDVDYAAGCRHAAGQFLSKGHRRLAIVRPETKLAGDLQSEDGFNEGAGQTVPCAKHDGSPSGICAAMSRLFAREPRPTGLFVFHATHLLTVMGWLQRTGLRVPRDVSVICRDHQPFLEFMLPVPARYELDAKVFARKLSRLVVSIVAGGSPRVRQQRLLPNFLPGDTLGVAED
ncbi:MAG: substrate-binding domain-containing protein [Chthoniobacteraceae bacterium]